MKYSMTFHFPYDKVALRGLDEEDKTEYSRLMEYEVPFQVTQPAMPEVWQPLEETNYIINPNMVTYVEITEKEK